MYIEIFHAHDRMYFPALKKPQPASVGPTLQLKHIHNSAQLLKRSELDLSRFAESSVEYAKSYIATLNSSQISYHQFYERGRDAHSHSYCIYL